MRAGGKRIRPAFCVWGYRAAGGADTPSIWSVAAALELLHTMALIARRRDGRRRGATRGADGARAAGRAPRRVADRRVRRSSARGSRSSPATWPPPSPISCSRRSGFPPERQAAAAARFETTPAAARAWRVPRSRVRRGRAATRSPISRAAPTRSRARCWWARRSPGRRQEWTRPCVATRGLWGRPSSCWTTWRTATRPSAATREDAAALVATARATLGDARIAPEAVVALDQLAELVGSL